jgi:recombinational DNA repair ATPase RecF
VLVDDLPSELDLHHQDLLLGELVSAGVQALVSATELSPALQTHRPRARVFHVEQGQLRRDAGP